MGKCKVCGVGEAVVPDRNGPPIGLKGICRACHGDRLLGDLRKIIVAHERKKRAWERR
jgi:hypothetical protein